MHPKSLTSILLCLCWTVLVAACSVPSTAETGAPASDSATITVKPTRAVTATPRPTQALDPKAWIDPDLDLYYRVGQTFVVYFNQPMNPDSTLEPLVFIPDWGGDYAWSNNFTTLVFTPTQPVQAVTQMIEVSIKLASQSGRTLSDPLRWRLVSGDKPKLINDPGKTGLSPIKPVIELNFSQDMDKTRVQGALSVKPEKPMTLIWQDKEGASSERRLLIHLDGEVRPGQEFILALGGTALAINGRAFVPQTWSIQAPALQANFRRVTGGSRYDPFEIAFNYALDSESLVQALSIAPQLDFTTAWDAKKNILRLVPAQPLNPGTTWKINLDPTFKLRSGSQAEEESLSWSYTVPPAILGVYGITPENSQITIVSSLALDPQAFEAALKIEPAFDYDLTWTPAYTLARVVPRQNLPGFGEYTFSFDGEFKDRDSLPLADSGSYRLKIPNPLWNWNSGDIPSTFYISSDDGLLIAFDRPMQPTTTLASLSLSPALSGSWQWINPATLKLEPESGFVPGCTTYQLSLDQGALDSRGSPLLNSPHTWLATTQPQPKMAGFGEAGAKIQIVDSSGRRTLQMSVRKEITSVHLDFYRISLETLIAADPSQYVREYSYSCEWEGLDTRKGSLQAAFDAPVRYTRDEVSEVPLPEDLPPGIYIANAVTDYLNDQILLVVTPHTLALKYAQQPGGGQVTAWVSNINGPVLRSALVQVYDAAGVRLASGQTDANGVFQADLPPGSTPYLAAAWWDGKLTVSGFGGVWGQPSPPADRYEAYLYTDRPLYRPGQTVGYKGVVRLDDDTQYSLPGETFTATLKLRSPRGSLVQVFPVSLSSFGTFSGTLSVAEGGILGDYTLELAIGAETHTQTFLVQEYQKPDLQVLVSTERSDYLAGETFSVTVNTRYLFGQPVANAILQVTQYSLSPKYEGGYWWWPSSNPDHSISLTSDENGMATFSMSVKPEFEDYTYRPYFWAIEVTADDGSRQKVSSYAQVNIHPSALQPELNTGGDYFFAGAPLPVSASVTSALGETTVGQKLTLEVYQLRQSSVLSWLESFEIRQTHTLTTGADSQAQMVLDLAAGYYRLVLTSQDRLGHKQQAERYVYLHSANHSWLTQFSTDLAISVEPGSYSPGQTADLLVQSNFSGEALLTIERGQVLEHRMVNLTAPFTRLSIPILAEYVPNVFVSIQAWRPQDTDIRSWRYLNGNIPDARLAEANVELVVPDQAHALTVTITSDQDRYTPGQTANFVLQVTDLRGAPVQAEVSLALVDEAIFLLANDPAGEIHQVLFAPRKRGVAGSNSLNPHRFMDFGYGGGGGDDGGNPDLRFDFPDTALWLPALVTDENGTVRVSLTLPDNLTTWRLTARAVTTRTEVGQAETKIITQQPLMVRPLLPLQLTTGDTFDLAVMVHNYAAEPLTLEVKAQVSGLELIDSASQELRLDPGGAGRVVWKAAALESGPAVITFSAAAADYRDAVQVSLPVQPLAIPVGGVQTGQFQGEVRLSLSLPEGALPESQVRLALNASLAGSLLQGAEFLTGFPYGCVEQTMSRALPNAVIARAFRQFDAGDRLATSQLDAKIEASIQRLYGLQHMDGGWGWWYDDSSDTYQTAWVVFGLAVTRESGYLVDAEVLEKGAKYLTEHLEGRNAPTRAFVVYALTQAGYATLEQAQAQLAYLGEMDAFSQAALALALHQLGDAENAQSLADKLRSSLASTPRGLYAAGSANDGGYYKKFMSSDVRSSAMVLWALNTIQPQAEEIEGLAGWLQSQRTGRGWGSTNETAYSILALTDYWAVRQDQLGEVGVEVFLNGELLLEDTLDAQNLNLETLIPAERLAAGQNEVRLLSASTVPIYFVLDSQMLLGQDAVVPTGIKLERTYLDPLSQTPLQEIHPGDLVLVRLTVSSKTDLAYVLLEDHLPGGLQALNERLNTSSHDETSWRNSPYSYYYGEGWSPFFFEEYGYNQKEIHPDRVSFFMTDLNSGPQFFEYMARAVTSGTFAALPAEISAMYDKDQTGRSSSQVLTVLEK